MFLLLLTLIIGLVMLLILDLQPSALLLLFLYLQPIILIDQPQMLLQRYIRILHTLLFIQSNTNRQTPEQGSLFAFLGKVFEEFSFDHVI